MIHEVCPESTQPCTMKNRDVCWRRYKKHCTWDNDASVPLKVDTSGPHTVVPITISFPVIFSWISSISEISSLSKMILVLGKVRSHRAPDLCCRGTESPGWFDVLPENSAWDMRHDAWAGALSQWSCQLPVAHSCGLLNHWNSFRGGMFKLNAKFDADLLLYSLSHFECDGHTVHMLTQWCLPPPLTSTVKSILFMHMHSIVHACTLYSAATLHRCYENHSRYINNGWTFSRQIYM